MSQIGDGVTPKSAKYNFGLKHVKITTFSHHLAIFPQSLPTGATCLLTSAVRHCVMVCKSTGMGLIALNETVLLNEGKS